MKKAVGLVSLCCALSLHGCSDERAPTSKGEAAAQAIPLAALQERCANLQTRMQEWPDPSTRFVEVAWREAGSLQTPMGPIAFPAHCEAVALMRERKGVDGQDYAIRFRMRLPASWNGRFFFQGGG